MKSIGKGKQNSMYNYDKKNAFSLKMKMPRMYAIMITLPG